MPPVVIVAVASLAAAVASLAAVVASLVAVSRAVTSKHTPLFYTINKKEKIPSLAGALMAARGGIFLIENLSV